MVAAYHSLMQRVAILLRIRLIWIKQIQEDLRLGHSFLSLLQIQHLYRPLPVA